MAVGKIGPFDCEKDNWDMYIDRLEQSFLANDVKEAVKVATLITVIGSEAYELMASLCTPHKPSTKKFDELVAIMAQHLQPKPSILAERFKFRQRNQKSGESVAEYAAELKKLSKHCKFNADSLLENLRDQFVCGLMRDSIRQRLFTEDDIKFERAFKLAVTMETAETDAAMVENRVKTKGDGSSSGHSEVYQLKWQAGREPAGGRAHSNNAPVRGSASRSARDNASKIGGGPSDTSGAGSRSGWKLRRPVPEADYAKTLCNSCGGKHSAEFCKFKMYVCRVCNREGHLKRMCPNMLGGSSAMHNVQPHESDVEDSFSDDDEVNNFSIESDKLKKFGPYTKSICINGKWLTMEIDTGSTISCISFECYKKLFAECNMVKSDLTLKYYTGEIVTPVGKIVPTVTYGGQRRYLDLYVIDSGKTSLMGRQWLQELGIEVSTTQCHTIKEEVFNLDTFSSRYCEVFSDGLGRFTGGTVGFHLRDGARPVFLRARPLAYALREPVERALDQLVRDGVITPVHTSDWATPIVPVMKKDGTIRLCGDFKLTLNKCLEVDHFPLPKVDDLLAKLHGGDKFSKIDLSQAYAQFELDDSKKYTVINTHKGLFMYNRLIYGLASSPGIFQRKLEQLFADMPRVGVFLDDIIITGPDDREHLKTLAEVFERLQKYGLKVKKDKCTFFAGSVTYLGFVISKEGVHTCPDKIEAIKGVTEPTNISELRSFLGLIMYYAKFVPNISTVLAPLYRLLQKNVLFEWDNNCRFSFKKNKEMLISSTILAHYSPELPLILTTDASSVGLGAVISHLTPEGERPIAYASRVLNSAEKAYSQIEREALGIIFGIKKFHQYLYGRKFTLRTDHKPLVTIFGDKSGIPVMAASRMQRWPVLLAGYDYVIEFVRSDRNSADALSRLPIGLGSHQEGKKGKIEATYLNFIQGFMPITRKIVQEQISKDEVLRKVMLFLQSGWPTFCTDDEIKPYFARRNELYIDSGCIIWGYRLVIPKKLQSSLLKEIHMGHVGIVKMKSLARSVMWWPGIDADVERMGKECMTCLAESAAPPRAPPQPWPYVTEPWTRLHIDFMGPFHGTTFLVLIDATTKWLEVFRMAKTTASSVIKVLRETFARFGLPKQVVSDNGPPFSSQEYTNFMTANGVQVIYAPIYHPSSNGAAEGAVKLCKRAVKKALRDGCDIDLALQSYLMAYRNVDHCTTGTSPAMLLQHRNLRSRLDLLKSSRQIEDKVSEKQRKQIDYAGGISRDFSVGETVMARNYTAGEKWVGGHIERKVGSRNYVISRENGPPIRRHVDQIRSKWSGAFEVSSSPPPPSSPQRDASSSVVVTSPKETKREGSPVAQPVSAPPRPAASASPDPVNIPRPARVRKPVKRYGFDFD